MRTQHFWHGVRMHNLQAAIDPDAPLYSVSIPELWEAQTATAILQLCPEYYLDSSVIRTDKVITDWLYPLCEQADHFTVTDWGIMLLSQQACPNAAIWKQNISQKPAFTVNLAAFASTESGFNAQSYRHALQVIIDSIHVLYKRQSSFIDNELPFAEFASSSAQASTNPLSLNEQNVTIGTIYLSNLDACLAKLGLDYDSPKGRDVACCITCFATLLANVNCGSAYLPLSPDWNALPELTALAKEIWASSPDESPAHIERIATSFSTSTIEDILLGSESCGLAPVFSPLTENGQLTFSTITRLAKQGLTPENALALMLSGKQVIQPPSHQAHYAMYQALAGFVTLIPPRPHAAEYPLGIKEILPRGVREPLPPRHKGITQKASIAGRGLFLRTGEYTDGKLGEISITPIKENAMVKGLLDSLGQAISIGLQYGVPLKEFVSAFAYSRFGIAGTVEGDPGALYATSFLDYSFRVLSDVYLNQPLPDAPNNLNAENQKIPMLPLDLPEEDQEDPPLDTPPRHSRLKLVS